MAGIFKAYDVRGIYPTEIDEPMAKAIGLALPAVLDDTDLAPGRSIVVGRDMRPSSVPLQAALVEGLLAAGLDVIDVGLVTTPMSYFAVGHLGAAGGVQVTASHNPPQYNGFKFSKRDARPVSGDRGIPELERRVTGGVLYGSDRRGRATATDVMPAYREHVLRFLRPVPGARRLKVAVDAANGMGCLYRPLLEEAGIDLELLYFELDGTFPNHEPNPLKLENLADLCRRVRETGADLGVSFDGDADRAAFVDERGEPVGSDLATALIAGELLAREPGKAVVYDLRSSRAVAEHITASGGIPIRERVGHSFIKATLRRHHGIFGGELAGHYYFRDNYHADCSLAAVFEILNVLRASGRSLSELVAPLQRYWKTQEINFEVEDKAGAMAELARRFSDGEIDYLDGITVQYPDWWFNVRPSNTEPLLRLVLEADTREKLDEKRAILVGFLGEPV
ncbi:MAG TPA: phosphomannomutase/phosphoglucomutase [Thermoanaerobaculia bacterium]|nr:phosphomannomutase/phosphoglucomutase [Thermoanaerobaculia bacterium]